MTVASTTHWTTSEKCCQDENQIWSHRSAMYWNTGSALPQVGSSTHGSGHERPPSYADPQPEPNPSRENGGSTPVPV
ncbi:hypothetical protein GCM10009627_13490 [Curtobacterium herbarum]|uniref:Uncharacterized protein n=1 Tax=Curtobacterium herbarum TaxID=150122 RepID=A0ABP4K4P8_9MICO